MLPAVLGVGALGALVSRLFVYLFDLLVVRVGRKIAMITLSIATCIALFVAFWTTVNGLISFVTTSFPITQELIPHFFKSTTDEYIAAFLAIRTASSIVIFNYRFVQKWAEIPMGV